MICPASLKINWLRESAKWLTRRMTIAIGDSQRFPDRDVVIINYEALAKHCTMERQRSKNGTLRKTYEVTDWGILNQPWDLLVVDEAHLIKAGAKSQRGCIVTNLAKQPFVKRKLFLTGTPIVNRPVELWPLISSLDPKTWNSWWKFTQRYCEQHHDGYALNVKGASNLDELQHLLRGTILLRRLKSDVLTELPPKRRQVIELAANGAGSVVAQEQAAWQQHQDHIDELRVRVEISKASENPRDYEEAVAALRAGTSAAFTEMAKVRHAVALAKVPYVIEHVTSALEDNPNYKCVVFGWHLDVLGKIAAAFAPGVAVVTGEISKDEYQECTVCHRKVGQPVHCGRATLLTSDRQKQVDRFQTDPQCQVFVGNIQAAGVGFTLTASSHVVFAELTWVPGELSQAEDRLHRISQRESVLVQHLVLEGSLDAKMAQTLVEKQRVMDEALDRKTDRADAIEQGLAREPAVPVTRVEVAATHRTGRRNIELAAAKMTPERIAAVHECIRLLAGVCDGASSYDSMGFSKVDVSIGHQFAGLPRLTARQAALGAILANKYHRQLPAGLLAVAKGQDAEQEA